MTLDARSSNEITPGVRIGSVKSQEGGLIAPDDTGRGIDIEAVENAAMWTFGPPRSLDRTQPQTLPRPSAGR